MANNDIKHQYIDLISLLNHYAKNPIDKHLLQKTHAFCSNLYGLAQIQSDEVFAQPNLYKKKLPYIVNITFNACIYTCLMGVRNKFDATLTIQLMCASLSLYGLHQKTLSMYYRTTEPSVNNNKLSLGKNNPEFLHLLKRFNLGPWLIAYKLYALIHSSQPVKLSTVNPIARATYLANQLALMVTPSSRFKKQTFAAVLKTLTSRIPMSWYDLISPLISYPGLISPGCYIKKRNGDINLVIARTNSSLITRLIKPANEHHANQANSLVKVSSKEIKHAFNTQAIANFDGLNAWWNEDLASYVKALKGEVIQGAFIATLPIQHAPTSLLILQDQLKQADANLSVIEKAIENDSSYAEHLLHTASTSNRQKQKVKTIKYGLAMLGLENSGYILQQYSLLVRLNQQYFPLQQSFLNFSQIMANITSELAFLTKLESSEMVKSLSYFALSRLYSMPSFRLLTNWNVTSTKAFKLDGLVANKDSYKLNQDALLLAKSWQLSSNSLSYLQKFSEVSPANVDKTKTSRVAYILGLSLIIAKEIYFSDYLDNDASADFRNNAYAILKISEHDIIKIKNRVIATSEITTPIYVKTTFTHS